MLKIININVDRPEISVVPSKIYITKLPTQVRFNCTVSAYPLSNVYWTHSFRNKANTKRNNNSNKKLRETHKKNRTNTNKERKLGNRNLADHLDQSQLPLEHIQILNKISRYSVSEQTLNETLKQSSILINVENEDDLGVYECYSNNSAGYRAVKFHIYGDQFKSTLINIESTTPSTSYSNNKNRQLDSYLTTRSLSSAGRMLDKKGENEEENLLIDEKLITNESNNENSNNREIKFDLTTISNLQTSKSSQSTYYLFRSPSNNTATSLFLMLNILLLFFY